MKMMRKVLCFLVAVAMVTALITNPAEAATKAKLNKKKVTLTITNSKKNPSVTLKVKGVSKNAAKKAKWSTSNKKVVTVKKGKVTAKKAGKATITCKLKGKNYTCKITVKDKRTDSMALNITITEKASDNKDLGPDFPRKLNPGTWFVNEDDAVRQPSNEGPYGINKIMVTYNGKDVTNKVKYEIDEPQVACVVSPGVIKLTDRGMLFRLTVSYKDKKRTFRMAKTQVTHQYAECYGDADYTYIDPSRPSRFCGALVAYDDMANLYSSEEEKQNDPLAKHMRENHCTGFNFVQYIRWLDIRIK